MIKFIVAAIWICGVTAGSIFFAFSSTRDKPADEAKPAAYFGGLDYVKTDVISVPVVVENAVQGYFIARFVYTAEQKKLAAMTVPAESVLIDEVYTYLYSNPMIDFTQAKKIDIGAFRTGLRDAINKRLGEDVINEVLIEQVDFLSKDEIRNNAMRRRTVSRPAPAAASETTPEAEGHEKPAASH